MAYTADDVAAVLRGTAEKRQDFLPVQGSKKVTVAVRFRGVKKWACVSIRPLYSSCKTDTAAESNKTAPISADQSQFPCASE